MTRLKLEEPFHEFGEHIAIELPGARAIFTTRRGGVSKPPYDSFNLGFLTDDDPAAVRANRDCLTAQLGVALAYRRQVHGGEVHIVAEPTPAGTTPADGDGVASAVRGVAPLVLAADCLPVMLAGPGGVAAVHAGWQGLAKGVLARGVAAIAGTQDSGTPGRSSGVHAAIGPGAGPCCYEVSEELHERLPGYRVGARNLDLKAIAADQLRAAGVETVHDAGLCTICTGPGVFFSHRRDHGTTGRQAGLVWLS
jgi:hypothetical protein